MSAITYVDPELCTCYEPGWWAKHSCVNGWGTCYYIARLSDLTPLSVAQEYVRRNIAVGNTWTDTCRDYIGGSNDGGRIRFHIGGYLFPIAEPRPGEQRRYLHNYEMYVRVDDQEAVFDLHVLWREATTPKSSGPIQAALFSWGHIEETGNDHA